MNVHIVEFITSRLSVSNLNDKVENCTAFSMTLETNRTEIQS